MISNNRKLPCIAALYIASSFLSVCYADQFVEARNVKKPNIVMLFVDDMGWMATESRTPKYETPNITQLASQGMEFDSMHIATPTCSPSRATLLTGLHPARLKMVRHIPQKPQYGFDKYGRTKQKTHLWEKDPAQMPSTNWLDTKYITYAEALKQVGYYSAFVGKWHLGHEGYHPIDQGFDQQIGTSNFGHPSSYYPPYFKFSDTLADGKDEYLTDRLTREAVEFIDNYDKEQPFMLSLWYYGIHSPVVGRKDLVAHFKAKGMSEEDAQYASMITAIDESVGKVRQALSAKGLEKDTIIMFLSDQGGLFDNSPLRGSKRIDTLYEGGARVPFIVSWPGVIKEGVVNHSIVQSTDLFPTIIEFAGVKPEKFEDLDGVSLVSTIKNNTEFARGDAIYGYRAYQDLYASVREDEWKLLAYRSGLLKLYNIPNDVSETTDLADKHPEIVARLKQKLQLWEKEMGVEQYSGVK